MRPWQRNLASASRVEDASQAGKPNKFSSQAKEFVPKSLREKSTPKDDAETKSLREKSTPKDDAETTQIDGSQPDKKSFPWRIKQQTKTTEVEDEDDDDSTTLETVVSTLTLDCGSSTAPSCSRAASSTDISSTPSEHDDQQEDVSDTHTENELEAGPQDEKPSKEHECGKDETLELKVSANSWAARRRACRNNQNSEELSDEEIVRKMKGILNKLTIEKFPVLSKQLGTCGIKTSAHLELLIQEIFEKAVSQHNFINMYADLCVVLQTHFAEHPISDDSGSNLKKILLNACQCSFERHLTAPANLKTLEGDDLEVAELMYKMQMIGNIKLVGALIVRKMLASKVLFAIVNALLSAGIPEALETLAALLTVVGPSFDRPDCQHRALFVGIFDQIEVLSKDKNVKTRIRCLLRDVLELRAADWEDSKPKKLEGPSTLEEVAEQVYGEGGHRDWYRYNSKTQWGHDYNQRRLNWAQGNWGTEWEQPSLRQISNSEWEQGSPTATRTKLASVVHRFQEFCPQTPVSPSVPSCDDEQTAECTEACVGQPEKCKEEVQRNESQEEDFDKTECNKKIAEAFIAMMTTRDIHQAVASIAALQVPDSLQSDQLCDLLRFIVEAGLDIVRSLGYQLIVAIYTEGCWSHASLVEGFRNFDRLCASNEMNTPDLANILGVEMVTAFTPLIQRGLLPINLSFQVDQQPAESSAIQTDDASQPRKDVPKVNRRKKKSLIDKAAAQRQLEEKSMQAVWAVQEEKGMQAHSPTSPPICRRPENSSSWCLGQMVAPSVYYCGSPILSGSH